MLRWPSVSCWARPHSILLLLVGPWSAMAGLEAAKWTNTAIAAAFRKALRRHAALPDSREMPRRTVRLPRPKRRDTPVRAYARPNERCLPDGGLGHWGSVVFAPGSRTITSTAPATAELPLTD